MNILMRHVTRIGVTCDLDTLIHPNNKIMELLTCLLTPINST